VSIFIQSNVNSNLHVLTLYIVYIYLTCIRAIFIDMKNYPDDPNLKYGRTYNESGFGLIIRNLAETDVNKTYECIYGFQASTHQYLLPSHQFIKLVKQM
jgi:hypothetical protein